MSKDSKKQEDQEKMFKKIREEFKEEVQELKEKIKAQNAKIRALGRRIEELEEKLLDKEEREAIRREKETELETNKDRKGKYDEKKNEEKVLINKMVKIDLKDDNNGFVDRYIEQLRKSDVGIRRKMIIISKGIRFAKAKHEVSVWVMNIVGVENRKKMKAGRYMN